MPVTWTSEPARVARLQAAGVEARLVAPEEVPALEPELTGALYGASFFPRDLQCAPREIARGLTREAAVLGARVLTGCEVSAIEVRGGRVAGLLTRGGGNGIGGDAVVLAAGAWSAARAATAGLRLPVEPRWGQLLQLAMPPGRSDPFIRHKVVDGSYMGSVLSSDAGLQVTTVLETTSDGRVLVGSSRSRRGFDTAVDESVSTSMLRRAERLMPGLEALRTERAWAGLRPWLPDNLPAIGPSSAADGLWVATGHEGAGVALGPITGRLIAQALCGEPADTDLAPFDPDRFA